jgi:hypothetical protein
MKQETAHFFTYLKKEGPDDGVEVAAKSFLSVSEVWCF